MRRRTESKPKKRMSAEDRKKAILETTVSFISQFGFWGFTIRDVAQAQNITEAGLLYYFRSKEQLLEETLKYADRTNQIAIAEHLGVEERDRRSLTRRHRIPLRSRTQGHLHGNRGNQRRTRPEMVRLYTLLESEALSKDHPVHEYFEQREINLLKEYTFAAKRDGVADPERTALQVLSAMEGLQLRWLNGAHDVDFVGEWKAMIDLSFPNRSLFADFSRQSPQHSSDRLSADRPA